MNKRKEILKKRIISLGIVIAVCLSMLQTGLVTVKAEEREIKVGYDINSNFIQKSDGQFYGYGVEYLNKIAEYTDWDYQYVNDESWQESLDKLRSGEIDLICTAHYTEERAEEFIYSDIPLGYETTLLYTNTDTDISYQDYEAISECKVGLLTESYSAKEFEDYIVEHGIACETIYFERENDMLNALEKREIDLLAIGSRYGNSDMQIVDRLGANAFYCIANKDNAEIIEEIDDVLQQIMFDDPEFEGELNSKYFGHNSVSNTPLYTKEEIAYVETLDTIKVKIMINQHPSCYEKDGVAQGIWVAYLDLLSEKSGIQFEVEIGELGDDTESVYDELLEQNYLLFRTQRAREYNNRSEDNLTTVPLMDIDVSYFERKETYVDDENTEKVVAITKDLEFIEPLLLEQNSTYQIVYCEDADSCFKALIDKDVDMVVQNAFWASYLMQKPEYADKVTEVPGTDYENRAVLVANEDQQMLVEILNKAINHVSNEEKDAIVTKELLLHPYPIELDDIWYQYWEWMAGIVVVVFIALTIYTVLTRRVANLKVQRKEYELLQKKVQLDELTGLYNRTYFFDMAKEMIENSDQEMCIIAMDISNFRIVNELYGMNVGDRLLKEISEQVLKLDDHESFIPARFMADHFYMCMSKAQFEKITLPRSFKTFLEDIDIRVVYGVFFVENQKELPINVMCDRAFIAAHDKHYKYVEYIHYYNDTERKQMLLEQEIENEMEKALETRQFYIVVQPKYDPVTEKIVGGETLVRWQHPIKGIISPGVFIPVFEKDGFIIQLDYFVWEETCSLLRKMKDEGIETVPISINVSRAHFYGSELINKLNELIKKYRLETKDIELEITESICGEDPETIYDKIRQLQEQGFKIAMDDFGSGYSSLNMLKEMPLDVLKMDLKFLDGEEKKSRQILKALIELAQTMELKVVVEGVEILSQVEFLRQFKDCYVQGYYFSRPVVSEVFEEMVRNN